MVKSYAKILSCKAPLYIYRHSFLPFYHWILNNCVTSFKHKSLACEYSLPSSLLAAAKRPQRRREWREGCINSVFPILLAWPLAGDCSYWNFWKSLNDNHNAGFVIIDIISNFECSCRLLDSRFIVILSQRDSETQFDSLVTQKGSSCSFISIYLVKDNSRTIRAGLGLQTNR